MRTAIDPRLRAEAARFALRFACEDCAHFAERDGACSLGYPAAPRRDALASGFLEFCKEFDLGSTGAP